ncbi:protein CutA homolog isoform X1 [Bradysia coprophila]|uniref:protein CutA homolog isoform X1 n=2 Tax=Bradysia coprophila TaxID=38358 RepID=UPI00187DB8EA|nr:protein CutA homolog isoform X1 [Bradysia coprophila]
MRITINRLTQLTGIYFAHMLYRYSTRIMSTASTTNTYQPGTHSAAFVTAPDETIAKTLARGLVTNKLAACVNIVPKIVSIYEWEGSVNEDSEVLLMIKTSTAKIDEISKFIRENHPYKVAEVISFPIENGNPPYLEWIGSVLAKNN